MSQQSTVPRWVLIGLALWALVYSPLVLYLLIQADMHWMFSFAAVIVPLWFGVRVWVHQTTRRRAERLRNAAPGTDALARQLPEEPGEEAGEPQESRGDAKRQDDVSKTDANPPRQED